jgi:hypothetical protein
VTVSRELGLCRAELRDAHLTIAAIVADAGGEVRVSRLAHLNAPVRAKLESFVDPVTDETVIRVKA